MNSWLNKGANQCEILKVQISIFGSIANPKVGLGWGTKNSVHKLTRSVDIIQLGCERTNEHIPHWTNAAK
jgi:hypothetical protein